MTYLEEYTKDCSQTEVDSIIINECPEDTHECPMNEDGTEFITCKQCWSQEIPEGN